MIRRRYSSSHTLSLSLALALGLSTTAAFAQQQPGAGGAAPGGGGSGGGGGGPAGGAAGGAAPAGGGGTVQVPTQVPIYPGGVAPPPPGGVLGGGNVTTSSSKPIVGNERDTFDLLPRSDGGGSMRGGDNGPIFTGKGLVTASEPLVGAESEVHTVRKGDTLWAICDQYVHNPYQWPRIWSYNPQIQNPHWIYPGDQVRLKSAAAAPPPTAVGANPAAAPNPNGNLADRRRQVAPDTIFLRDNGFIDDEKSSDWGDITGAREDKMFMSNFDEVYLRIGPDHDVKIGQELTVFRPIRSVENGKLVQIQGTVRVDQWNAKERVARAQVVESLDAIERGARIGPVGRRFEVVSPVRNETEVKAKILTSVTPHPFYGSNQVVFIDKGDQAGLKPGNRLFVVRRGDEWHKSMATPSAATRIALESDSPAATERVPKRDDSQYPEEVVGELRVMAVRKGSAACLVTRAAREIEVGDSVVARKGY